LKRLDRRSDMRSIVVPVMIK